MSILIILDSNLSQLAYIQGSAQLVRVSENNMVSSAPAMLFCIQQREVSTVILSWVVEVKQSGVATKNNAVTL